MCLCVVIQIQEFRSTRTTSSEEDQHRRRPEGQLDEGLPGKVSISCPNSSTSIHAQPLPALPVKDTGLDPRVISTSTTLLYFPQEAPSLRTPKDAPRRHKG